MLPQETPPPGNQEKIAVAVIAKASDIEKLLILEMASGSEDLWTYEDFENLFKKNELKIVLLEYNKAPICYIALEINEAKKEVIIWSLTVHPRMRRRGNGSAMLRWAKDFARNQYNHCKITSVVRESDLKAHLFLKANNFRCVKILRRVYECPAENGYLFEYTT